MVGQTIKEKDYTKYLGILIDKTLSWSPHIKDFRRYCYSLQTETVCIQKYPQNVISCTFIQPYIDYGLIVWGNEM